MDKAYSELTNKLLSIEGMDEFIAQSVSIQTEANIIVVFIALVLSIPLGILFRRVGVYLSGVIGLVLLMLLMTTDTSEASKNYLASYNKVVEPSLTVIDEYIENELREKVREEKANGKELGEIRGDLREGYLTSKTEQIEDEVVTLLLRKHKETKGISYDRKRESKLEYGSLEYIEKKIEEYVKE